MDIGSIKITIVSQISNVGFQLKQNAPELLLAGGIAGVATSTVLACRGTLRSQDILAAHEQERTIMDQLREDEQIAYTDEEYEMDKVKLAVSTIFEIAREYAPAVILGTVSIAALIGSNRILTSRNAALMAAYKVVDEGFKKYRKRVVDEFGEEVDYYLRYQEPIDGEKKVVDMDGKEINYAEADLIGEVRDGISEYARFFDHRSIAWRRDHETNLFWLKSQQNQANDRLQAHGHLFLNDVYEMMGMPKSRAGIVVGWHLNSEGDGFVDFGLNKPGCEATRDYVNGYEQAGILLDFNVDGVIYDHFS